MIRSNGDLKSVEVVLKSEVYYWYWSPTLNHVQAGDVLSRIFHHQHGMIRVENQENYRSPLQA